MLTGSDQGKVNAVSNDGRAIRRSQPISYLRVTDRNTDEQVGRVIDLTTEGIRLVSEQPIGIDQIYQLKMIVPQSDGPTEEVVFDADSIWHKSDVNPDFFDTGMKINNLSPRGVEVIEKVINYSSFRD